MSLTRRHLMSASGALGAALLLGARAQARSRVQRADDAPWFGISLAQWSLHRSLRSGQLDALDFPRHAAERHGIRAVEYVNQFFADKAADWNWLAELRRRADGVGVTSLLIMIDGEGSLAHPEAEARAAAVDAHFKWIAAASFLGCHAIRVNVDGSGEPDAWRDHAAHSLRRLAELGAPYGISVIVENHGKLSSNGAWLASVMAAADHPGVGTLPDFGNFRISEDVWYDRYQGVAELMPYAKAVSAKSHDFDQAGNERHTDYLRMLAIVRDAGYRGHVGIEYEGGELSEDDGIAATLALLLKVRDKLARS